MNSEEYQNLCAVNRALIRFRGAYAAWAAAHGMSHTEMLALYDLRDDGICTQKRICTRYRIPPQTVNHTILNLRARGLLQETKSEGREKAFALTESGRESAQPLLDSLNAIESRAIDRFTPEKLASLAQLLGEFGEALDQAIGEEASAAIDR